MAPLPSYFTDFLANIRLQQEDIDDLKRGHSTLRQRLLDDATLGPIIVSSFLQGSYRRATAIRPENGKRSDVDVVVVTKLDKGEWPPQQALEAFQPFMDKHYAGKYTIEGRSIGIELSYVDLDCVITAAPSVSEEGALKSSAVTADDTLEAPTEGLRMFFERKQQPQWQAEPLWILDRDAECWTRTHPLEQSRWTHEKNRLCNGHYVNIVKALKWWRRINYTTPKYPKGYPVEHLIGQCCPDGIGSVAEGVTTTLETIATAHQEYARQGLVPEFPDHGVPEHDVFKRISGEDFAEFHVQVCDAAAIARRAYDEADLRESISLWQQLFGDDFPGPPPDSGDGGDDRNGPKTGGFTPRQEVSRIGGRRFA